MKSNILKYFLVLGVSFSAAPTVHAQQLWAHNTAGNGEASTSNVASVESRNDQMDTTVVQQPEEYVDVAYGQQTKQSVTSSVFTISGDDLVSNRSTNLMIALQGRLPGLRILQNDGEPGNESFNAQIRGYDSPNSNGIMYVVDGVERVPFGIDPNEVESITVLRDAAATAMYGMRGSGGVLLIKTKSGIVGKTKINVSIDHSIQSPTRKPRIVSAQDYVGMFNQRVANDTLYADVQAIAAGGSGLDHSSSVFYTAREIERYQLGDSSEFYPSRNMVDEFMENSSKLTRLNVNFQGGSDALRFFTSVSYMNQGGLFKNEPFDRYSYDAESKNKRFNFRTNLDMTINPTLNMFANIGGYMEKRNAPFVGSGQGWDYVLAKLYETPNNAHNDLTPDGEVLVRRNKLDFRTSESVYGYLNRTGSSNQTTTRLNNTFGLRQDLGKVLKGLSASAQLAFDIHSRNTLNRSRDYAAFEVATFQDINMQDSLGYAQVPGTGNTTLSDGQTKFFYYMYNYRGRIDYNRQFGAHSLNATLLAERHTQQQQELLNTNYVGMSGRAAYGYMNKYFAEANFAYQGSEQFKKGNNFGLFPSLALGWVASNESFLQDSGVISYLKLRTSYGTTGNSVYNYGSNNQYLYLTTWNNNATEDQIGNESIKWETSTKVNFGVEAELFNSLYFSADIFSHKNTDVIISDIATIPSGFMGLTGGTLPPANIGESENKGFELVLGYDKEVNEDWYINVIGNISHSKNKQTYTAELPYDNTFAYAYRRQGFPINQRFGYKSDGLFNSQEEIDNWADQSALGGVPIPGDIKYVDLTGDDIVDERDLAPITAALVPNTAFGLRTQVNYKGFDLNVFINGVANRDVYLNGFGRWSNRDNFTESMKNAWTQEKYAAGETIDYPRLGNQSTNYRLSDYWVKSGSYVRLRNVELGFTFPEVVSDKLNATSIRVYANGLNLLVWDNLPDSDFDPESASSQNINYPIIKAFNFGLNMQF